MKRKIKPWKHELLKHMKTKRLKTQIKQKIK